MIRRSSLFAILSAAFLILGVPAMGQGRPGGSPGTPQRPQQPTNQPNQPSDTFGSRGASITVRVTDETGLMLDQQALVKLSSPFNDMNLWRTTQDRSEVTFENIPLADYQVEVSAAGYKTTTQDVSVMAENQNYPVFVELRRSEDGEPAGLPGQVLVGKARTEAQKGIAALNVGKLKEAQKHLEKAYKVAPGNADLNYLMAVLCSRNKQTTQAEAYLQKAVSMNPKHVRALTMLGELRLRQKDYKGAIASLEQAVSADQNSWSAHWLLADAYLKNGEFEKSREQAELAIRKGKGAAAGAQLVLGEALANLGRRSESIQALETYLREDPQTALGGAVRKLIAQLGNTEKTPERKEASVPLKPMFKNVLPSAILAGSSEVGVSIPTWQPPSVDDETLSLAQGAVCPASRVIAGAGRSAERLVDNVSRFEATEKVTDQELNVLGKAETTATLKFDYIASIDSAQAGGLLVDEYRTSFSDQADFPDHILTRGLAALALVFHPTLRGDYDMTCEGLGQWKGRATWLVYFRQRPDRPTRFLAYEFTNASYPVALKGRAWIAAGNFQIVHLEADLLNPMRNIQLLSQHQSVDYGPVYFSARKVQLWLPKTAELYFDFRRHRYYRRDSFDNFKLFAVAASEKIGQPNMATTPDPNQPPQQ
jgi:tetratricopeptide (TPR) repeat protein